MSCSVAKEERHYYYDYDLRETTTAEHQSLIGSQVHFSNNLESIILQWETIQRWETFMAVNNHNRGELPCDLTYDFEVS